MPDCRPIFIIKSREGRKHSSALLLTRRNRQINARERCGIHTQQGPERPRPCSQGSPGAALPPPPFSLPRAPWPAERRADGRFLHPAGQRRLYRGRGGGNTLRSVLKERHRVRSAGLFRTPLRHFTLLPPSFGFHI